MTLPDLLDMDALQAVATAVALALSVVTFWRQEAGKRSAALTVTFERVKTDTRKGAVPHTYVVIHNSGPALARHVTANFVSDGSPGRSAIEDGKVLSEAVNIPAGHAARLRYVRTRGSYGAELTVRWKDQRRGHQSITVPVNVQEVSATPPVVNVTVRTDSPEGGTRRRSH